MLSAIGTAEGVQELGYVRPGYIGANYLFRTSQVALIENYRPG